MAKTIIKSAIKKTTIRKTSAGKTSTGKASVRKTAAVKIHTKKTSVQKVPKKILKNPILINRELSWLSFNDRVLQEANDNTVPLIERLKFLGIFSSNLDEFFRVRVATNKRMLQIKNSKSQHINRREIQEVLQDIYNKVVIQQVKFNSIYSALLEELRDQNIYFVNEKQINIQQTLEVRKYFKEEIINTIFPLILNEKKPFPFLRDNTVYLACKLTNSLTKERKYALIPLPTKVKKRFYQLPRHEDNILMMFIDDVIRCNLDVVFSSFEYNLFEAYTIKLTRDAEIDLESDVSINLLESLTKSLKQRKKGQPVRLIYDQEMPEDLITFINHKLKLNSDELIPGQRYHNFRDFIGFPDIKKPDLKYYAMEPLYLKELDKAKTMFNAIRQRDFLISHPYQPFSYIIRMLREAAIDPDVQTIKITLYRVAENSNVVNALINAVKNGKKVVVLMELKARFDEEHNIYWSNKLKDEGATVLFTIPSHKVHTKICLIYRKEKKGLAMYAHVGTGNYNGETAKIYCDHSVLTCNKKITSELVKVFDLIEDFRPERYKFNTLLVSPINLRQNILSFIDLEIRNKKAGKPAYIKMKMNSLVDEEVIRKLYQASNAGVRIDLIVRGICCLVPGVPKQSQNIHAVSIIDKYLEHARVYIFCNGGKERMYMGSADMMTRNLDNRVEVCFPILSPAIREEMNDLIDIQLSDNTKARIIDAYQINEYKPAGIPKIRSQTEFYNYLRKKYNSDYPL